MPALALPVVETYNAIERPVAVDIAKRLASISGLDVPIIISFPGANDAMPLFDSRLQQDKNADSAVYKNRSKFSITVTESYLEGTELNTIVRSRDAPILFADEALGVEMYPVYSATEVRMSFTYRAQDRREAEIFRDQYRIKLAEGVRELVMSAAYEIPVPKEYLVILKQIHTLREKQGGYGETWAKWMNTNLSPKATVLTTMAGTEPLLVFKERQEGILGYWDFDLPPEHSKGETGSTYELSMDFIYTYEKPINFVLRYPLVVHNQMLPKRFVPARNLKYYSRMEGTKSETNAAYDMFRKLSGYYYNTLDGISQPFADEFSPRTVMPNMFNALTQLIRVDLQNPRQVISLKEFYPYRASQGVLDALTLFQSTVTVPYMSPFTLCLFENGIRVHESKVEMDAEFNVSTNYDMDIRKTYHLGIYLLINPALLQPAAESTLLNNPTICLNYADTLRCLSDEPDYEIEVLADRLVNRNSWWYFVRTLRSVHSVYRNKIWQSWNLVASCTVVTEVKTNATI